MIEIKRLRGALEIIHAVSVEDLRTGSEESDIMYSVEAEARAALRIEVPLELREWKDGKAVGDE